MNDEVAELEIPEGWACVPLIEAATLQRGYDLPVQNRAEGIVPVLASNGQVGTHNEPKVGGPGVVTGRSGSIGHVQYIDCDFWPLNTALFVSDFHGNDQKFISFLLTNLRLEQYHAGTGVPTLNRNIIHEVMVPIPPLAEQKRIVAKVETLLARVNAARQRLAKVPALLKRFRQSVLAAACSGQLTKDSLEKNGRKTSTTSIIKELASERGVDPPNVDGEDDIPEGWERTTFGFLVEPTLRGKPYITSGSRGWAEYVAKEGPYFIRSENINTEYLRVDDAIRVDPPEGAEADRTRVRPGDLLLTITGNNVGRTAVVPGSCPPAHVSQHVAIIRFDRRCNTRYLWLWLRSREHGQRQLNEGFYGETKPGLNLEQVRSVWVDLPPLAEQHEIVRRVEALLARADRIEKRLATATRRVETLTQAILAQAFRGELVPTEAELARREGRAYEPASALLERIRGQKEKQPRIPQKRKRQKTV